MPSALRLAESMGLLQREYRKNQRGRALVVYPVDFGLIPVPVDDQPAPMRRSPTKPQQESRAPVLKEITLAQQQIDRQVWEEEEADSGPVTLPDLRDPRVRAEVRRKAADQEARLQRALRNAGLHVG